MADPEGDERIQAAVARVFKQSQSIILERVALIERMAAALSTGASDPGQLEDARRAAHMLAGTLGTFGLEQGSVLARDVERRLASPPASLDAADLVRVSAELRANVSPG